MLSKLQELTTLTEASQPKFKKGDVVKLNKKFIADLKKENPEIDYDTKTTAIVSKAPIGSKNPGEPWRWKIPLTTNFFGSTVWPEFLLVAASLHEAQQINEAGRYNDSTDFESDISDIEQHLKAIDTILNKAEFADWIDATDENYSSANAGRNLEKVTKALDDLKNEFDDFYNQIVDASSN